MSGDDPSEVEQLGRAADQLADAIYALDDVDLNTLIDEEVRTLIEAKQDIRDVCLRLRQDHQANSSADTDG